MLLLEVVGVVGRVEHSVLEQVAVKRTVLMGEEVAVQPMVVWLEVQHLLVSVRMVGRRKTPLRVVWEVLRLMGERGRMDLEEGEALQVEVRSSMVVRVEQV